MNVTSKLDRQGLQARLEQLRATIARKRETIVGVVKATVRARAELEKQERLLAEKVADLAVDLAAQDRLTKVQGARFWGAKKILDNKKEKGNG